MAVLYNTDTTDGNGASFSFRGDTTGGGAAFFSEFAAIQSGYATHDNGTKASSLKFYTSRAGSLITPIEINTSGNVIANNITALQTGNVGIGTSTPGTTLGVNGDAVLAGALTIRSFNATSTSATSTIQGFLDVLGTGTNSTSTYASNLWVKGGLQVGTGSIFLGNNYLNFNQSASTTLASGVNAWNIGGANLLSIDSLNNRIGIATQTPTSLLSIAGTTTLAFAGTSGLNPQGLLNIQQNTIGTPALIYGRRASDIYTGTAANLATSTYFLRYDDTRGFGVNSATSSVLFGVDARGALTINHGTSTPIFVSEFDPGSAYQISLEVAGNYAYIGGDQDDLFRIVDITNPASPAQVDTLDFNGDINSIAVLGRYAYLALGDANDALAIVDISIPASLMRIGNIAFPADVNLVVVAGKYAYIGLDSTTNEFRIIDVSNPAGPSEIGSLDFSGNIVSLVVSGRYAYIGLSNTTPDLAIVDISNPSNPILAGSVDFGSSVSASGLAISGRYAYITHQTGTGNINFFRVIDISNPQSPSTVTSLQFVGQPQSHSLVVSGGYAYLTNSSATSEGELKVIDISVPTNPVIVVDYETGATLKAIKVRGRYAYILRDLNAFQIFDLGGAEISSLLAHSLESGSLYVQDSARIGQNLLVDGGLNVGAGGIYSQGFVGISLPATTTTFSSATNTALLTLTHATGTFAGDGIRMNFGTSTYPTTTTGVLTGTFIGNFLNFLTGTTSRLVVNAAGNLGIGTSSPYFGLTVGSSTYITGGLGVGRGTTTSGVIETTGIINVGGSGTSTFANGINATTGCFAQNGTCLVTGVGSVSNSDGTLTISPTTGNVIASLNLGSTNTWTGGQTFNLSTSTAATSTYLQANYATLSTSSIGNLLAGTLTATSTSASSSFQNLLFVQGQGTGLSLSNLTVSSATNLNTLTASGLSTLTGGILANSSTSTITNLTMILSTSTQATTTYLNVSTLASTSQLTINGGLVTYGRSSTSTIPTSAAYAWTLATSTSAVPILSINTNGGLATTTAVGGFVVRNQSGGTDAISYDYTSNITSIENLELGSIVFGADSGEITAIDMPVSSSVATGTIEAYSMRLDGTQILTIHSVASGSGSISTTTVGIGTTTPAWKLTVSNSATTTTKAFIGITDELASANQKTWTLSSQGGFLYIATSSDAYATSSIPSLTITANNLFGIGTSSPSGLAALSIQGNTYLTGGLGVGVATTSAGVIQTSGVINVGGVGTSTFANGINLTGGCITLASGSCIGGGGSGTINSGTTNRLAYYTGGTTLDSANFLTVDATNLRLGLATSTPATTLSVAGNTYLDSNVITYSSSTASTLTFSYQKSATSTIPQLVNAWSIGTTTAVGNPPILSIDGANGRVGIGTAGPGKLLEVNGESVFFNNITFDGSRMSGAPGIFGNDAETICLGANSQTTQLCLSWSANKVGFGTGSPNAQVDVLSSNPQILFTDSSSGEADLLVSVTGNLAELRNNAGSAGSLLNLDLDDARVGIGTSTPLSTLSVYGSTTIQSFVNTNNAFRIQNAATSTVFSVNTIATGVGIGTSTKLSTLTVQGRDNVTTTGTASSSATFNEITCSGACSLTTQVGIGDQVRIGQGGEVRTVTAINSDTVLVVDRNFTNSTTSVTMTTL
ncbi:MAG: hypothetical protein A2844_02630, partial [Candidatus Ryanbacteria bacterium RIFCSPHIGHO2_01_FULL_48_80]